MTKLRSGTSLLLAFALGLLAGPAAAQDDATHGDDGWHRHHVGLYVGGAYREKHYETGWVLEGEYEYRFLRYLGVGPVAEGTFDVEGDPWLLALPVLSSTRMVSGWGPSGDTAPVIAI